MNAFVDDLNDFVCCTRVQRLLKILAPLLFFTGKVISNLAEILNC